MTWSLRTAHDAVGVIDGTLSLGANLLLLLLIATKTNKEFRAYSRVLACSCVTEALFSIAGALISPVSSVAMHEIQGTRIKYLEKCCRELF